MSDQTLAHALHDLGGAAWFGGSLMGVVALPSASKAVTDPHDRIEVEGAAWRAWQPIQVAGIAAHLLGGALLTAGNSSRLAFQKGAPTRALVKTAATFAAIGVTAFVAREGARIDEDVPATGSVEPSADTPEQTAERQRRLQTVRWAVPALTGASLALGSRQGEKQRPSQILRDTARRLLPTAA